MRFKINRKSSFNNRCLAFTLVEMLISLGLFSMVIIVIVSIFIQSVKSERLVTNQAAALDNLGLTIEEIAREARTGINFPDTNQYEVSTPPVLLEFTNYHLEVVRYRLNNSRIEKKVDDENYLPLTSANVKVSKLNFLVQKKIDARKFTPRVTVAMEAETPSGAPLNLQTTVGARLINY